MRLVWRNLVRISALVCLVLGMIAGLSNEYAEASYYLLLVLLVVTPFRGDL